PLYKPEFGWEELERSRQWAMRSIRNLNYSLDMKNLILRYTEALDQSNLNDCVLRLWGIIERITDTIGSNYDETTKRMSWVFKDRKLVREMLQAIRVRRNQHVHSGRSAHDRDQVAYLAKYLLDPHILILLRNDFKVSSLEEYARVLALPENYDILREMEKIYRMGARIEKAYGP
ncbi:MAG: hypothetical protein CUN55_16620, partial [Phototrophicales bacterium]